MDFIFFGITFIETGAAHKTSHHLEKLALEHVTLLLQGLRPKLPFIYVVTYTFFILFLGKMLVGFRGKSCNSCEVTWASRRHPWGVASQPDPWWHLEQAKSSLSSSQCLAILPSWSTASPPSTTSNSTSLEQRQLDPQPHLQALTGNSNALLQS